MAAPTDRIDPSTPVVLLKGTDPIVVGQMLSTVVDQLVGGQERSLVVEEFDAARYENDRGERQLGGVADAAATPPFLTDTRVVVARHLACFTTVDSVAPLLAYLDDPLPSTRLVLVWEPHPTPQVRSGAVPKKLLEAVTRLGQVLDVEPGKGKDRAAWVRAQLDRSSLKFHKAAVEHLIGWTGEDAAQITALLATLEGAFPRGAHVGVDDIAPFMGEAGGVAPWDLTDAIDAGDVRGALDALRRMLHSGRHALVVMVTLHNHLSALLSLDGADIVDERGAAELLRLPANQTFKAKRLVAQSRRLGPDRLREMIDLLARADLDLKGARQYPGELREEMVMEVLVARLAARSRR